ncbi:hypothetical protein NL487_26845, partial [Klebsiella pneumoniae]|nr:hypothetical protein [Klebsiella pneumoniae]
MLNLAHSAKKASDERYYREIMGQPLLSECIAVLCASSGAFEMLQELLPKSAADVEAVSQDLTERFKTMADSAKQQSA